MVNTFCGGHAIYKRYIRVVDASFSVSFIHFVGRHIFYLSLSLAPFIFIRSFFMHFHIYRCIFIVVVFWPIADLVHTTSRISIILVARWKFGLAPSYYQFVYSYCCCFGHSVITSYRHTAIFFCHIHFISNPILWSVTVSPMFYLFYEWNPSTCTLITTHFFRAPLFCLINKLFGASNCLIRSKTLDYMRCECEYVWVCAISLVLSMFDVSLHQ